MNKIELSFPQKLHEYIQSLESWGTHYVPVIMHENFTVYKGSSIIMANGIHLDLSQISRIGEIQNYPASGWQRYEVELRSGSVLHFKSSIEEGSVLDDGVVPRDLLVRVWIGFNLADRQNGKT